MVGHSETQLSQGNRVAGEWSTLQEIKELLAENRSEKRFTVLACPIKIRTDNMWYRAHQPRDGKKCLKKVTENSSNPELFDCRCGDKKLSRGRDRVEVHCEHLLGGLHELGLGHHVLCLLPVQHDCPGAP